MTKKKKTKKSVILVIKIAHLIRVGKKKEKI